MPTSVVGPGLGLGLDVGFRRAHRQADSVLVLKEEREAERKPKTNQVDDRRKKNEKSKAKDGSNNSLQGGGCLSLLNACRQEMDRFPHLSA